MFHNYVADDQADKHLGKQIPGRQKEKGHTTNNTFPLKYSPM
mgnify:CR=1 FL=1